MTACVCCVVWLALQVVLDSISTKLGIETRHHLALVTEDVRLSASQRFNILSEDLTLRQVSRPQCFHLWVPYLYLAHPERWEKDSGICVMHWLTSKQRFNSRPKFMSIFTVGETFQILSWPLLSSGHMTFWRVPIEVELSVRWCLRTYGMLWIIPPEQVLLLFFCRESDNKQLYLNFAGHCCSFLSSVCYGAAYVSAVSRIS